jgi:hypothetical protein
MQRTAALRRTERAGANVRDRIYRRASVPAVVHPNADGDKYKRVRLAWRDLPVRGGDRD